MANKYMKKSFNIFSYQETQIETTWRCHLTPVRMAVIKKTNKQTKTFLVRMWQKGTLTHCWGECKLVQPLWQSLLEIPQKLIIKITTEILKN
jgi:hypothetical protein